MIEIASFLTRAIMQMPFAIRVTEAKTRILKIAVAVVGR